MDDRIWLLHPATQNTFHCPADAVPAWEARGWERCEPPTEPNLAVAEFVPMTPPAQAPKAKQGKQSAAPEPKPESE